MVFVPSLRATEQLDKSKVLYVSKHVNCLFEEPAVREELCELRFFPHFRNVSEVHIQVTFDDVRG